jgi:hypothetical protein
MSIVKHSAVRQSTNVHPQRIRSRAVAFTARVLVCALLLGICAGAQGTSRSRLEADRAAILADVAAITQAYLDGDVTKIYSTHAKDWTGFLGRARVPIKGLDQYMRFQGLTYPPPTAAAQSKPQATSSDTAFRMTDADVNFITPDVGVANLILEYGKKSDADFKVTSRMRITDVYAKRKGLWIQVASHTSMDPSWQARRTSSLGGASAGR